MGGANKKLRVVNCERVLQCKGGKAGGRRASRLRGSEKETRKKRIRANKGPKRVQRRGISRRSREEQPARLPGKVFQ